LDSCCQVANGLLTYDFIYSNLVRAFDWRIFDLVRTH
jgi:hypothetical protein